MKEFPTSAFANAAARCRPLLQSKSKKMGNIPDAIQPTPLIITRYQGDRRKESATFFGIKPQGTLLRCSQHTAPIMRNHSAPSFT
jgi:hypothetical protein